MIPKPFLFFFRSIFSNTTFASASFFMACLVMLTGCNVDASFGYAFAGTGAIMLVALVIATVVTSRNKKKGGEK